MATLGGIHEHRGSENNQDIEKLARFAVEDYNKKQNSALEFQKVINTKEQVVSGITYYITMEVKDGNQKKLYEATIWVKPWMDFKQVEDFKLVDA